MSEQSRNQDCDCCDGIKLITPQSVANRPGLDKLNYRAGIHATFLETMKARLSLLPQDLSNRDELDQALRKLLSELTTRDSDDPAIALLDAWATVADVLTFYQERIANEGYLRTATERESLVELARMVGYQPRPGVAASVFLAFTLEKDARVEIPIGARAQSVPGPGELPQSFETSERLQARVEWNALKPRLNRPHEAADVTLEKKLYLKGISTNLKRGDPLLVDLDAFIGTRNEQNRPKLFRVLRVQPEAEHDRTIVEIQPWLDGADTPPAQPAPTIPVQIPVLISDYYLDWRYLATDPYIFASTSLLAVNTIPSVQPRLPVTLNTEFRAIVAQSTPSTRVMAMVAAATTPSGLPLIPGTDLAIRMLSLVNSGISANIYTAWRNLEARPLSIKVYALRVCSPLFGSTASPKEYTGLSEDDQPQYRDWDLVEADQAKTKLFLSSPQSQILPGTWVAIQKPDGAKYTILVRQVAGVGEGTRSDYGISSTVTSLGLESEGWNREDFMAADHLTIHRQTTVFGQTEELELADVPLEMVIQYGTSTIDLSDLYEGLEPGRVLAIAGERADIPGTSGVRAAELARLASVTQNQPSPGARSYSTLNLDRNLTYSYNPETVTIYANVVEATHGETKSEVLGSGNGSKASQKFELKQFPLTFTPAATPNGVESSLKVYVNDILWHEAESIVDLGPNDHDYITTTNDVGKTTITFGDGRRGARLPSGSENVRAVYRAGIGRSGNVGENKVTTLATRPLGVKEVINPLPATGGADRESRDSIRRNAPLSIKSLGRLISPQDYEDFTRSFGGIGKAQAAQLVSGGRERMCITIAGVDDSRLSVDSRLVNNLRRTLRKFGDPDTPVVPLVRALRPLFISASIKLNPDYLWDVVEPQIRAALLDTFQFERRDLGQDAFRSEAIATIQHVPGVIYVRMRSFDAPTEDDLRTLIPTQDNPNPQAPIYLSNRERIEVEVTRLQSYPNGGVPTEALAPAQLVYLVPNASELLEITEITE